MSTIPSKLIASSKPFHFLVGPQKAEFWMHADLVASLSKPLDRLVNGPLKEAQDGSVEWPDVDEDTFVRFWQYAYLGYFEPGTPHVPGSPVPMPKDGVQHPPPTPVMDTDESYPRKRCKCKKKKNMMKENTRDSLFSSSFTSLSSFDSKHAKLWNDFVRLKYPTYSDEENQMLPKPKPNTNPEECHAEVFLSIARVYMLADYYDIKDLVTETLRSLHEGLTLFTLHVSRVIDIVQLLEYSIKNSVNKGDAQDGLRALVYHYAACKFSVLWGNERFKDLMHADSDFMQGVIERLLDRLD